uniref:regulatory factor X-associated protein n=1 Tax=Pristiophorus japonicus TaxID=55135 RepID=UPI00398E4164
MSAGHSERGGEVRTPSPRSVSHQELTTVTMAAACDQVSVNLEGGRGGALETVDNRDSPGETEEEEEEEEDDEEEDEADDEMEEEDEEDEEEEEEENGDSERVTRKCVYEGCTETTMQVAKPRKPWMCKKHRNKTYKDKYKKRKSVQAMSSTNKSDDDTDERPASVSKQRLSCMMTVHQASRKASLLEQVLNQKRLSLLRSPEVVQFLQQQQRLLSSQALSQRQQFQETPM